ncbi:CAZyme family GH65 [Paecilomyces variotii]|nr:CAZyme family GH65 [Paecilomyces variotii]KAJ9397109.1 CAZyme family GH65 [Paecilomyces variotii]
MRLTFLEWGLLASLLQSASASAFPHDARVDKVLQRYSGRSGIGRRSDAAGNSSHLYSTRFPGVSWDQENWRLESTTLDQGHFQSRGSVANGYIGINVASAGPFFELDVPVDGDVISGWPLFSRRQTFATISGFFDLQAETNGSNFPWLNQYGGESVISGVPHWSGLILDLGNDTYLDATVDNETISDYTTTFDYKAGLLSWSYTWKPKDVHASFNVTYRLFAHKLYVNQAVVHLEVTASADAEATVANVIDGYSAVRTDFVESGQDGPAIYSAVRPWGINNVTAYVYAIMSGSQGVNTSTPIVTKDKPYLHTNDSSIAQLVNVKFPAGKTVSITKFVGAASSDAFSNPQQTAKKAALKARATGYEKSLHSHVSEWANVMPDGSVDDFTFPENGTLPQDEYIIDSAVSAVTNPYYLLQNTVGKNAIRESSSTSLNSESISVGGLTSDSYAGQIFWDADTWMQPGIAASHPEAAQCITNYRIAKYGQARENIHTAFTSSKNKTHFSDSAAIYSWTSGRFGNCTGTGPCFDYEYHLNGDIGLSFINQWVATGDDSFFKEKLFPIYDSIATMFSNLLERNGTSWTLTNMTDPDEYANHVDAGGYTMPLIAQTLLYANAFRKQFGIEQNSTWMDMSENVLLLRENGVTLEYTTMNGTAAVKQADVVLDTYPLNYDSGYSAQDALNDLDYYAGSQSPDGPAMTWAIFSIVASEVSPSGCSAYTYGQNAYVPYARAPFYQLSEQMIDDASLNGGTHPAYPFLTGSGGANQVVLFGYLGLRLLPDNVIHIDPNLPPQVPHVKYRTFYWRGWPISAKSNYTHTTIQRATDVSPLDTADPKFANVTIPVHVGSESNPTVYRLPVNGTLTVTNRQIASRYTVAGNIAQCKPVTSTSEFEPGQFPIAAVDGATSTKWQPSYAANVSAVTVSLSQTESGAPISGFYFDWAQAPPVNATVIFHNNSVENPVSAFSSTSDSSSKSDYSVVLSLHNISFSDPYNPKTTDLNAINIPRGNSTNVTLSNPVPVPRFATLLIVGNQALSEAEVQAKNGTGATVAEWSILAGNSTIVASDPDAEKRRLKRSSQLLGRYVRDPRRN